MRSTTLRAASQWVRRLAPAFALATALGCAVSAPPDGVMPSQPAARMALRPEYRVFHDALEGYGEWILIEPYGFVFRPKVNFESWRPYTSGFWTPTDVYGWTWVSDEPFGWATYHYGNWTYDDYQGWVWIPGVDWGPSWVSWTTSGIYVGWAPLGPGGLSLAQGPANATTWVEASNLGATNLPRYELDASTLGDAVASRQPADNVVNVDGVRVHTGPSFAWVEQHAGPLRIAKLRDLVRPGVASAGDGPGPGGPRTDVLAPGDRDMPMAPIPSALDTQRAAERAAREARDARRAAIPVPQVPVVRPFGVRTLRGAVQPAPADSTR